MKDCPKCGARRSIQAYGKLAWCEECAYELPAQAVERVAPVTRTRTMPVRKPVTPERRESMKQYRLSYYHRNKERMRELNRQWVEKNRDRRRETQRAYYERKKAAKAAARETHTIPYEDLKVLRERAQGAESWTRIGTYQLGVLLDAYQRRTG